MGGGDGDAVKDSVHGDVGQPILLVERNPELIEVPEKLRVSLIERIQRGFLLGCGVVADVLQIDGGVGVVRPLRLFHGEKFLQCLQSELEHPIGFLFESGDQSDCFHGETLGDGEGVDVDGEAEFLVVVAVAEDLADFVVGGGG